MELSSHFQSFEFEHGDRIPTECLPIFKRLCAEVLEPIREKYGIVYITSGYRSMYHNAAVGGVSNSQHVANSDHCAADFTIPGADLLEVFDWIRTESLLPIDQLILEYGLAGNDAAPGCIHISVSQSPRYEALTGLTHGRSGYAKYSYAKPDAPATPSATPAV